MPRRRLLSVRDWPLSLKLATTVLLLAVIPLLLAAWVNAREVESQSLHRETQSLRRRAAAAARRLEERVGRLRAYVELIARNPTIIAAVGDGSNAAEMADDPRVTAAVAWDQRHPEIYALLTSLRSANPWFSNVYLLDPGGVCIATSERATKPTMIGRSYDYRPYFQAALEDGEPFVTDVLKNATSPGTGIFVSAPVRRDGAVAAVVVLKVESAALHEVVADLARTGGSAVLVDRFGIVVSDAWTGALRDADDPRSLQFHPLAGVDRFITLFEQTRRYGTPGGDNYLERVRQPLSLEPLWNAMQQRRSGAAEHGFPRAYPGPTVATMVGYAPVVAGPSEPYGYVLLGEPAAEFRGPLREIGTSALVRSGLVAFGVALVIALLIRRFSRQVVALAHHARRLADGERPAPMELRRRDELGVLAKSIRRLAEHVHGVVEQEQRARARSERDRDVAEARTQARAEAIERARAALDGARRTLGEAGGGELRGGWRRLAAPLDGAALDLAALGESRLEPRPTPVDVAALVREVLTGYETDGSERPVTLVEASAPTPMVEIDRAMLRRTIEHLVDNACKFTRRGRVEVHLRVDSAGMHLAVSDTGIGLTARQADRISTEQTEPIGDGGIGLWVTRRLVRALGGSLHALGEVGSGSTVTLRVPIAPDPSPSPSAG